MTATTTTESTVAEKISAPYFSVRRTNAAAAAARGKYQLTAVFLPPVQTCSRSAEDLISAGLTQQLGSELTEAAAAASAVVVGRRSLLRGDDILSSLLHLLLLLLLLLAGIISHRCYCR